MNKPFIIAIDGPSASGKGTLARRLAAHYDFAYLDTGLLYRAVGFAVLEQGFDPSDTNTATTAARALDPVTMVEAGTKADHLRQDHVSVAASKVAAVPDVRASLLKFQQDFCIHPPHDKKGAVLDGRDIGTVIAPTAPVKIYVTASDEVRANRRTKELQGRNENVSYDAVLVDLKERDARDAARQTAPAKPADDAIVIDTSAMTADEAFAAAVQLVDDRMGS